MNKIKTSYKYTSLKNGQPCSPTCHAHIRTPCEKCGRVGCEGDTIRETIKVEIPQIGKFILYKTEHENKLKELINISSKI